MAEQLHSAYILSALASLGRCMLLLDIISKKFHDKKGENLLKCAAVFNMDRIFPTVTFYFLFNAFVWDNFDRQSRFKFKHWVLIGIPFPCCRVHSITTFLLSLSLKCISVSGSHFKEYFRRLPYTCECY